MDSRENELLNLIRSKGLTVTVRKKENGQHLVIAASQLQGKYFHLSGDELLPLLIDLAEQLGIQRGQ